MPKKLLLTLGGLILLIVLAYGTVEATSKPGFCANCHEISGAVASWKTNPHKSVPCLKCHADPGTFGLIKRKVMALREVYLHMTGKYPKALRGRVNFHNCVLCHTGKIKAYAVKAPNLAKGEAAFDHTDILDTKTSCLECHREVAHGTLPSGDLENK